MKYKGKNIFVGHQMLPRREEDEGARGANLKDAWWLASNSRHHLVALPQIHPAEATPLNNRSAIFPFLLGKLRNFELTFTQPFSGQKRGFSKQFF